MRVFTIDHGTRSAEELVATLAEVVARTPVDVRRFPGSRRNPQFNQANLAATLDDAGVEHVHVPETLWWWCHRQLIAGLLAARGQDVVHLIRPGPARTAPPLRRCGIPRWETAALRVLRRVSGKDQPTGVVE